MGAKTHLESRFCSILIKVVVGVKMCVGWLRYTALGQNILVEATGLCLDPASVDYLRLEASGSHPAKEGRGPDASNSAKGRRGNSSRHVTHRAVITGTGSSPGSSATRVTVSVPCCANRSDGDRSSGGVATQVPELVSLTVPLAEVRRLNDPQICGTTDAGHTQLEDGIRCNYASPLTKAKMCEVALALASTAESLDFDADPATITSLQLQAVRAVRSCLCINTFQGVGGADRARDRQRYCGDDAARFAVYGQGHCHTVSSVMFAFLQPFSAALGIDVRYRGGQSFTPGQLVANAPETHQWLELTARPSGSLFTCDLYMEDGPLGGCGKYITEPIAEAYSTRLYPHARLLVFSGQQVRLGT